MSTQAGVYVASRASNPERPAMWREMVRHWPDYDAYQQKTERLIPLWVLERA